mgnify:CR=1 FL=1
MVVTNYGKSQIALVVGGSAGITAPTYFIIGSGSGTALVTQTALLAAIDRQPVTSTDMSVTQKVKWTGDWTSSEISGTALTEFGMIISGGGLTGSLWSRSVIPAITFDGTNELRIEENWQIY